MTMFQHTIEAHVDFELDSHIKRNLEYSIEIPDGEIRGLVVYIAGFGEDAGPYKANFQSYICKTYRMACLAVNYHCVFCRPSNGGNITIETETMKLLRSLTGLINHGSIEEVLVKASEMKVDQTTPLTVPGNIYPGKNEYQNFGLLPALDNIFAINDVFMRYPHIPKTIYAIGSSYGGYIANLISKLAPSTLNVVFDNSSWATPNLAYINGSELGLTEFFIMVSPKVRLELNVISPWTHFPFMPNYFNEDRKLIRSFPENHLDVMAKAGNNKTIYRFVHAGVDHISDTEKKLNFANNLKKKGFDVQMEIYSEKDVDGTYIKNLDHGMGLSMRLFFAKAFNGLQAEVKEDRPIDFDFDHCLYFACEKETYAITYRGGAQPECALLKKTS